MAFDTVCFACLDESTEVEFAESGLSNLFTDSTNREFELVEVPCDGCDNDQSLRRVA